MSIYRVVVQAEYAGQLIENCFGVFMEGSDSSAGCLQACTAVADAWYDEMIDQLVPQYGMTGAVGTAPNDPTVMGSYEKTGNGGSNYEGFPAFVVAKAQMTTGLRGRSYRGATGISGLPNNSSGSSAPNELQPGTATALQGAMVGFLGAVFTAVGGSMGFGLAVISTHSGGVKRPLAIATPVTGITVPQELGSRNSRKG